VREDLKEDPKVLRKAAQLAGQINRKAVPVSNVQDQSRRREKWSPTALLANHKGDWLS
jgi:hypothetical protein